MAQHSTKSQTHVLKCLGLTRGQYATACEIIRIMSSSLQRDRKADLKQLQRFWLEQYQELATLLDPKTVLPVSVEVPDRSLEKLVHERDKLEKIARVKNKQVKQLIDKMKALNFFLETQRLDVSELPGQE